ncbi:hypothetical protein MKX03_012751 [Papaver bracteatum]|nr:hypothetical protein MKX03_012751 [Papaver bracteatum]
MASGSGAQYPPSRGDHRYGSRSCGMLLTNDDVLGDAIPKHQQDPLRRACYSLLKLRAGAANKFPGSNPVSLNSDNLQSLKQTDYRVTWKSDGTRYMILINSGGCYLIDRSFNFRRVRMRFPLLQQANRGTTHNNSTLLDGEMVIDTDPKTLKQKRRYLAFDLMAINGVSVIESPFGERLKMLEEQVIRPRRNLQRNPYYNKYDLEPFGIEVKKFWLLSDINDLVNKFTPELSHDTDGLIFQGWNDRYVPFTHLGLLKWKPPEMNSVDFLFELDGTCKNPSLYLYEGGTKKFMRGNRVVMRNGDDAAKWLSSGSIIECSYYEEDVWCFMRVRKDKNTPNAFRTYESVMRSIKDNITEEVLLDRIRKIVHFTTTNTNAIRRSTGGGGGHGTWRPTTTHCKTSGISGHLTAKCHSSCANKGVGGVRKEWVPKVNNKIVQAAGKEANSGNEVAGEEVDDRVECILSSNSNETAVRIGVGRDGMVQSNVPSHVKARTYSGRFNRTGRKETLPKQVHISHSNPFSVLDSDPETSIHESLDE